MHETNEKKGCFSPQLREGLKTTVMGLGLMRLQMDIGQIEEARATLASLQIDYELLIFGIDKPMETLPMNSFCKMEAYRGKRDSCELSGSFGT